MFLKKPYGDVMILENSRESIYDKDCFSRKLNFFGEINKFNGDRDEYLTENYRQLSDHSTCTDVKAFNQKLLSGLTEICNIIFQRLCNKKLITIK